MLIPDVITCSAITCEPNCLAIEMAYSAAFIEYSEPSTATRTFKNFLNSAILLWFEKQTFKNIDVN